MATPQPQVRCRSNALRSAVWILALTQAGCGDGCERACREVSFRIDECAPAAWGDLGARNRSDFVLKCRAEWDRRTSELTSSNLNEALEVCGEARDLLKTLDCEDVRALYLP